MVTDAPAVQIGPARGRDRGAAKPSLTDLECKAESKSLGFYYGQKQALIDIDMPIYSIASPR